MRQILLLILILLISCGGSEVVDNIPEAPEEEIPPPPPPPTPEVEVIDGEVAAPAATEPEEKVIREAVAEEPELQPAKDAPKNPADVQNVLDRFEEKIKSYGFRYAPPPDNLARHFYNVYGEKVKVEKYEVNVMAPGSYYDTVYLDYDAKTAHAYCLEKGTILCGEFPQGKELPFHEFGISLPHHFLPEIVNAEMMGSETLYDRQSKKLLYNFEGRPQQVWVDQFSGIPVRVKFGEDKESPMVEFRYLAVNSVDEADVVRPE